MVHAHLELFVSSATSCVRTSAYLDFANEGSLCSSLKACFYSIRPVMLMAASDGRIFEATAIADLATATAAAVALIVLDAKGELTG